MARSKWAGISGLAFLVLFAISGVAATATVKETTVAVSMSLPKVLFSLTSACTLLLPLSLCAMLIALLATAKKQASVGMLFAAVSFVCFGLFIILFAGDKTNATMYTPIKAQLKDLGISFRKRDLKAIDTTFDPTVYFALACAGLTVLLVKPPLRTDIDKRRLKRELLPYAYIGPHLLFFVIFFVTPAIYGVYAAFTRWDLFNEPVFTGLDNFKTILFNSGNTYYKQLRNGLWNTIKFVIYSVPLCIALPLSLAVALNTKCRGNKFFQALYYLPSLMSITTVTLTWRYVFNLDYGMVNKLFGSTADWFTPPYTWIMLVVVTVWWCAGFNMVIYQSALASILRDHFEAAAVDGANGWQRFLHIIIPGIRYPLMYTLIMSVIAQFNIYGQPLILTGFSNGESNAVLLMYIYENAVKSRWQVYPRPWRWCWGCVLWRYRMCRSA